MGDPKILPLRGQMPTREEFEAVVARANRGDDAALDELRKMLEDNPTIWSEIGDVAAHAREAVFKAVSGPNILMRESLRCKHDELRRELCGATPSPIERLAVDRVLLAWMQLNHVEIELAALPKGIGAGVRSRWLKRQSQATRLYDSALKSLATLRRLTERSDAWTTTRRRA